MIESRMGRSHGPRAPRRHRPWEPEPLHLPVDRPGAPRPRPSTDLDLVDPDDPDDAGGAEDLPGTHVVVIDLA
jgi:hypothetical protein